MSVSRAVFCDWHRTLCHQPFWHSALEDAGHPLHRQVSADAQLVFGAAQRKRALSWMRGQLSAEQMLDAAGVSDSHTLLRLLHRDCETMQPDPRLLSALKALPADVAVALATDNTDCFADAVPRMPALAGLELLCSSQLGVLKAESACRFFGPFMNARNLNFCDCLLIDDVAANCRAFERLGGKAIRHRDVPSTLAALASWAAQR